MVKDTTCSSNIETLAFHFALIGVCYVMAVGIGKILSYIPGFLGTSMSSMMFMNGMYAAFIVVVLVTTAVTFAVCFYFGQRIGGANDFERTLGLYGTCTGTVPSGIALVRIIDPEFKTTTSVELGAMNLVMLASTPVYIFILAYASDSLSLPFTILALLVCTVVYLILLKATKSWGKKSYHWK